MLPRRYAMTPARSPTNKTFNKTNTQPFFLKIYFVFSPRSRMMKRIGVPSMPKVSRILFSRYR